MKGIRCVPEEARLESVRLHLRNKQTDKPTDARNRIWCILA